MSARGRGSSLDLVYQNDITIVEEDMGMQHSWSGVLTEGFYWVYVTAYNAAGIRLRHIIA
ncbi:MAG: hypothetical protein ACLTXT_02345 [Ruminococcus callidus]